MGELKIVKLEKYNRFDTTYLAITVLDDGVERVENFAGDEWLELDETGEEKFVSRIMKNKKDSDKAKKTTIEDAQKKYEGKTLKV